MELELEFRWYESEDSKETSFGQIHYYTDYGEKITTHNFDIMEKEFNDLYETYLKCNDKIRVNYKKIEY